MEDETLPALNPGSTEIPAAIKDLIMRIPWSYVAFDMDDRNFFTIPSASKTPPITKPREILGLPENALIDLQLILRYYGLFKPWLQIAMLSFTHTDEIVDENLEKFKLATETALEFNGLI